MADEGTRFLASPRSPDDFDIELLLSPAAGERRSRRTDRFGPKLRFVMAAACAVATCWALSALFRPSQQMHSVPITETVELQALTGSQAAAQSPLKPLESMHDGNPCDGNEELYGGLCYKRCSVLTQGEAPIRTSSWTCCESHPCAFNQKGSVGSSLLCNGFDVSGQGGCPHKAGACLLDEELHLGICYQKCSLLTKGTFPYRIAAATCCKTQGLGCLDIFNDKTSNAFDVGGGSGDHDPSTPAEAHPPEESWTESGGAPAAALATTSPSLFVQDAHFEPVEHLHDGNVCDDEEELYGGLCYKQCGLLTGGEAPIRTSSWTCCKSRPCGLLNQKGSLGHTFFCNGYDVSADGSCPHKPGACLMNEEMVLGVCYEQCSLLTNGAFPHRLTAATCCKVQGMGCLNPLHVMTSDAFDIGGGGKDDDDAKAHLPDESLTEAEPTQQPHETLIRGLLGPAQGTNQQAGMSSARIPVEGSSEQHMPTDSGIPLGSALPFNNGAARQQPMIGKSTAVQEVQKAAAAVAAAIRAMK